MTSLTIRGFTPGGVEVPTSTASSPDHASLLSLGIPLFSKGTNRKLQISRNDFSDHTGNSHQSGVISEWSSGLSGRKISIAKVRDLGPFIAGDELILQCEVIGGGYRQTGFLEISLSLFDIFSYI